MSDDTNGNNIEIISQNYYEEISQNDNSFRFSYSDFFSPNSFSEEQELIHPYLNGNIFDYIDGKQKNISFIKENDDIIQNKTENENDCKIVDFILINSKEEDKEKNRTKEEEKKAIFKTSKKIRRKIVYKGTFYEYDYDSNKYQHSYLSNDNIAKKIENHFLSFLILFLNIILVKLNCKQKFFHFNKKLNIFSNSSKENIRKINDKTIEEILHFEITKSQKKMYIENIYKNKSTYEEVLMNIPQMKDLFKKKINDIFNEIYYNKNQRNLRIIDLNKYNINLIIDLNKEKLENFEDLLKKIKKEESKKMEEVVESDYFRH